MILEDKEPCFIFRVVAITLEYSVLNVFVVSYLTIEK